ncbi:biotin carboxyl carrier protein of acetyl-CoA carboxylase-like [Dioscorea cayenensis subsp. rotundata]|uniref:Biotin carboxyl carrier protein of acetyl-CoA carboxylase-like n=1 Tax=Dioscorea cayennensis subsp. rotundata TaxID=55577 RepID=A0AB40AQS5_DIOCR|nr:biotin carboxyl carrier protein of acetyl-CoA carboxylase-like [Dioscorea cayenensis subsp. rotundata]
MASCSLGASTNTILPNLLSGFKKIKCSRLDITFKVNSAGVQTSFGLRGIQLSPDQVHGTKFSWKSLRPAYPIVVNCGISSAKNGIEVGALEEEKSTRDQLIPFSPEVESLLNVICDTTSIAEFGLNLSGFRLYVKRDINDKMLNLAASSPPIQISSSNELLDQNGFVSTTSLTLSKPKPSPGSFQQILDSSHDEGLMILQSPKVGFFRRSRTIKGKKAPPSCKEKQQVKEGQVICYVEQLGGEIPIESDVSGEVIKIFRRDGEPVGYGDALIAILPSFPGIKKLQ